MKRRKKINNKYKLSTIILFILLTIYSIYISDTEDNSKKDIKDNINYINNYSQINDNEIKVTFIDVGEADSILIQSKDKYILIDGGNTEDGPKLVNFFKSQNISKFDIVVATHPHEDHIGGLNDIINNFNIDKIYMPNAISTSKTYLDLLNSIEKKSLSITIPKVSDEFSLNDIIFKVLFTGEDTNDLNDSSIILLLTYKNNKFLFTGDASSKIEKIIINNDIKADVLKVGHHGSSYSSNIFFLKSVNPSYSVISVGKNNNYHHPTKKTLNNLKKINSIIYRTDKLGTIEFISDGNNLKINNYRSDTNG